MWRGIKVEDYGEVIVHEGSIVADADTVIVGNDKAKVKLQNANLKNFVIGVYVPVKPSGLNGTNLNVQGSTFDFNAYKLDYSGQAVHGVKPEAGIVVNDLVFMLGGSLPYLNHFNNLNTGLVGRSSIVTVKRSRFTNIQYDSLKADAYRGTAIVNVKSSTNKTTRLTALPEANSYNTVDSSYRGIYTDGSSLSANYVHLLNVRTAVESKNCPVSSTNMVTNCTITASHSGIFWTNNPFAKYMYANDNFITINGSALGNGFAIVNSGIYMSEFSNGFVQYTASGNAIQISNAGFGIYAGVLTNAKVKYNDIGITGKGTGISVSKNINANVSCNAVRGNYAGGYQNSVGIATGNSSNRTTLYCNTTDDTYRGFLFGGACPNSVFKGNEMTNNFNGLYLNNGGTYMGTQPNHGNKWNGTFGNFGAVNAAQSQLVSASIFLVDPALGSVYNPTVSPSTGWFFLDTTGNTFYCYSSTVCSSAPPALVDSALNAMIANGEIEPDEYVAETKAIAEEYLYRELADDSALWYSDSTYIQFMLENQGEPTAYLYDVEEYLKAAYSIDTFYMNLVDSCNLQITILADSINCISEGKCEGDIEALTYQIGFLNQTINNLYIVREATLNNNLENAELQNEYVVDGELPEINSAYMNEIEINYLERDNDIQFIIDNYSNILAVAQQCPYVGGGAVERARSMIAMVNDSIVYNDSYTCLQSGIYRTSNKDSIKVENKNSIIIKPNPANDKVEILLNGNFVEGVCKIEISNSIGEVVMIIEMDCKEKRKVIDFNRLSQGVYSINVNANNILHTITKLIIIK
jgi:hypothetical protein